MSRSIQEEIIAALWAIAAILCFSEGWLWWGGFFMAKAIIDTVTSITYSIAEAIKEAKAKNDASKTSGKDGE